jgi:CRISPR-associated protein Cas5d
MGYGFCVRAWGENALITRPEAKSERLSYEVLTPSAARGILDSVLWHPAIRNVVDRITVLKPIQFDSIRRNEVGEVARLGSIRKAYTTGEGYHLDPVEHRQQRASVILRDVDYLIDAHFEMIPEKMGPDDTPEKYYNMMLRRLRKGQFYSQPYFGCREFAAHLALVEGDRPVSCYAGEAERDLGWMLYGIDFEHSARPVFFHAVMRHGVIEPEVSA